MYDNCKEERKNGFLRKKFPLTILYKKETNTDFKKERNEYGFTNTERIKIK